MRIALENDGWAELYEPAELTNGQRRPMVIASQRYNEHKMPPELVAELQKAVAQKNENRQRELIAAASFGHDDLEEMKVADAAITALVKDWSLDLPIPSDEPLVDDATGEVIGSEVLARIGAFDYDALRWACMALMPETIHGPGEVPKLKTGGGRPPRPTRSSARSSKR